jgi:hypothetical protein
LHPFKATTGGFSGIARCYQDVLFDYKPDGTIEYLLSTDGTMSANLNTRSSARGCYVLQRQPLHCRRRYVLNGDGKSGSPVVYNVNTVDFDKDQDNRRLYDRPLVHHV